MIKLTLSDQTVVHINADSLIRFYDTEMAEGFKLKLVYENSIDNRMKERVTYHSGTASISGEISRLAGGDNAYDGLAAALKQYAYFSVATDQRLINTASVVSLEEEDQGK